MKYLLTFFCFLVSFVSLAEDLYFLNIKGSIKSEKGIYYKPGDKISSKDKIIFGSKDACAVVISSSRGRLILQKSSSQAQSELEYLVSNIVSPASGKLSTRSGAIISKIDFKLLIEKEPFLVLDSTFITIPSQVYSQDSVHFFYLKYHYKTEMINKKLGFKHNNLVFTPDIFFVDGLPINSEDVTDINLYYYNASEKLSNQVGSFNPVVQSNKALITELRILKNHFKSKNEKNLRNEMILHLNNTYGYLSEDNFELIYQQL